MTQLHFKTPLDKTIYKNMTSDEADYNYYNAFPTRVRSGTRGLQDLAMVDQLIINQKLEVLEENKYTVLNTLGDEVFSAKEESDCCTRFCFGYIRNFKMNIQDTQGQKVLHLVRPLRCQGVIFPCCLQELEVRFL